MNNLDLRLKFKMDTGKYPEVIIVDSIDYKLEVDNEEVSGTIEKGFDMDLDDVDYIKWLEDQLIKTQLS